MHMLKLELVPLPQSPARALIRYQTQVNSAGNYADRVAEAKRLFPLRNRPSNTAFRAVRQCLRAMTPGIERCNYCEDSYADQVEHIRPKDLYPEVCFAWDNYLYACGACNRSKSNRHAIIVSGSDEVRNVARPRTAPIVPPANGRDALIDPRLEDPLEFLSLDMLGTFWFVPAHRAGSEEFRRAEYTIAVLRLNDRDVLPKARRNAFVAFRSLLGDYRSSRDRGLSEDELRVLKTGVLRQPHQTVFREMIRRGHSIRGLSELVSAIPEAMAW